MEKRKNRGYDRKKRSIKYFLIEPFKQIKLGIYVILISLSFTAIAGFMIYQALTEQYQQVMDIFAIVDPDKQWSLITNDVFYSNAIKMTLLFSAYLIILMTVIISKTHKVYGPLVSIERFIGQITKGHYRTRITVRKGDELVDVANKLNLMAAELQSRHGAPDRRESPRDGEPDDELIPLTPDNRIGA